MTATAVRQRLDSIRIATGQFARSFMLVTLALVGGACGVLAVGFERYLEASRDLLMNRALHLEGPAHVIMTIAVPSIVFPALAFLVSRFAPRAVGANLARVRIAYNEDPNRLGPRTIAATFLGTPLSLGAGAPLGPEGPIVVVTSGFSAAVGRALAFPPKLVRSMIPVGVTAGIAAIFNAPVTGVVFALEEIVGTSDRSLLGGVLVGGVAAAVVERMLLGGRPLLAAPFSTWYSARELIGFALLGITAGVISGLTIGFAHRVKRTWSRVMPSLVLRAALAGILIGCTGLFIPSILGVGYDSISFWLHGGGTARGTAIACIVKVLVFVIAVSGGVLGGSFAPSLYIGTALGASLGHFAQDIFPAARIDPKAYAIIGMGAVFAGLLRSPIAAVLIVIELTRDYDLVLPLMLGVSIAVAISRRISPLSIVEQQMVDEGFVEAKRSGDPLAEVRASDAMTPNPTTIASTMTIGDAARLVAGQTHRLYPAVEQNGRLAGLVSREDLDHAVLDGDNDKNVLELVRKAQLVASAGERVIEIVERMQMTGTDRCPVIDGGDAELVVGFLSPSDILRVRMRRGHHEEEDDLAGVFG